MLSFLRKHGESLLMALSGLLVMAALNIMMLGYHYDAWTNPKVGFWTAFYTRFEISGFDAFTYITISQWRPLYALTRHPLLAAMMWPLSELNGLLREEYGINCAIFIVAVVWTLLALASWMLMYRIMRRLLEQNLFSSVLLTLWFFSFSHIMLVTFTPDHMSWSLPLLLLTIYLAGMAAKRRRAMPLWQSLPLLFVSTGVTTTNMVKVALADFFTQVGRRSWGRIVTHFAAYLAPLAIIVGLYLYQERTTQAEETRSNEALMMKKARTDSVFAKQWEREKMSRKRDRARQIVDIPIVTNTEYRIDRLPSLVENIFGEGILLHEDYALKDANRDRPALVLYSHWWYYAMEALLALLFLAGAWCGRRERIVWMTLSMFAFDMLLHVGLNFASADAYIMTAHWAFVIPISVAFLLKAVRRCPPLNAAILLALLLLTAFGWWHNLGIIADHLLG